MKKASKAKTIKKTKKQAKADYANAVEAALKVPANRSWNRPYNSSYVMKGGVPHKLVDGVFVPFKKVANQDKIVTALSWMILMNLTYIA